MSELVRRCCTFFWKKGPFRLKLFILGLGLAAGIAHGQDERKVPISFVPPPLENATYSLGIYEAKSGKLVRRLQEIAPESAFTVGLNGLMTSWDGKDDEDKAVPPGRYAARGYAVGALKVEGEKIFGNDWTGSDEKLRITHLDAINILPGGGLIILAEMADGTPQAICFDRAGEKPLWSSKLVPYSGQAAAGYSLSANEEFVDACTPTHHGIYHLGDGQPLSGPFSQFMRPSGLSSVGKDRTKWKIEEGTLNQYSPSGEKLRQLTVKLGEPAFVAVAASDKDDRLYLLESLDNWQRVRGLSWVETKEEDGKPVSTWQTFFERNIHPWDGPIPLERSHSVTIPLIENPLMSGKLQNAKLAARKDEKGSYLASADGLRLRQISENPNLREVVLRKGKTPASLTFLQTDGAAWDEFSIEGTKNMMEFDAGEFEMTAGGEKAHTEKTAEPPDL